MHEDHVRVFIFVVAIATPHLLRMQAVKIFLDPLFVLPKKKIGVMMRVQP